MSDVQTMVRTLLAVNDADFLLAQGQDIETLKRRIESAAATGPKFVDFLVVGNRSVSVLITATTRAIFSIETVQFDARDTGDELSPYGGFFDV